MKIEILIPTYNRPEYLCRNIKYLTGLIKKESAEDLVGIRISDNASSDDTREAIERLLPQYEDFSISYVRQSQNIGLEKNALYLLEHASAEYVMYLGDDDYIDEGYLPEVLKKLSSEEDISCIITGILAFWEDGRSSIARTADFERRRYESGFESCATLAPLGHQLSGLLLRREGLFEIYQRHPAYHNIYLFMCFVGKCAMDGVVYYLPVWKTRVLQGNLKDWKYDDSGLLTEMASGKI